MPRPISHSEKPKSHAMPAERSEGVSLRGFLLALLSGLMLTAAFPPGRFHWIAWFSLLPLFWSLAGRGPGAAFKLGMVTGLAHFTSLLYWIVLVLGHYGNLGFFVGVWPFLLLCLYLSLFIGLFAWVAARDSRSAFCASGWAATWVALEFARARLLTGFPWCLLGTSQYEQTSLIQLASVTGVYGLSFLIVLVNATLFQVLASTGKPPVRAVGWPLGLAAVFLAAALVYGRVRLQGDGLAISGMEARVAVVQANIDQSLKWDPAYQAETMDTYKAMTLRLRGFRPDLVVWPETATPFFYQERRGYAQYVDALVREMGSTLIFGSPAYRDTEGRIAYFNRAYLLSPDGRSLGYDKVHLVPFGEYVPLKRWLPFVHRLVPAAGDFEAGNTVHPLEAPNGTAAGILICFEAIFPEIAREHTLKGAAVLVNLTNDAWFGRTSAPHQHLAMTVFRAVENARPLVRAANTGISAFIDARGRITARTPLFERRILKEKVLLPRDRRTFYARFGDGFVYALIALALYRLLRGFMKTGGLPFTGHRGRN